MEAPPSGDAELLRRRYLERSEAFLDGVRGRFALALHDRERGLALAARSAPGHASLAYVLDERRFAVARESAELAALPGVGEALDELRLAEFYANEELSGPQAFFAAVRELLPGEQIAVDARGVRSRELARPRPGARLELPRFEDYVERFAGLLARSVERCLRGEERVAVLASGGLDSSPIAALAARRLGGCDRVALLSWDVVDAAADDRPYVEALAAGLGTPLEWIPAADAWPFADLSRWPVHPSTPEQTAYRWLHERSYERAAALGFRVVLAGFGGDALYGHAARWWPSLLAAEGPGAAIDRLREVAREVGWPRALRGCLLAPLRPHRGRLRRDPPAYLTRTARRRLSARPRWPGDLGVARRPRQAERLLALLDGHGEHVESWYTARHGVEQRTPARDPALIEFALAVPDHVLLQGSETRAVLRAAVAGRLPEGVRGRRGKADLRALLLAGLGPGRIPWAGALLGRPDALWRGLVEEAAVGRWLEGRFAADAERVGFLNCLYGELWRERRRGAGTSSPFAHH